jgi:AraC-like DNA-binding protein
MASGSTVLRSQMAPAFLAVYGIAGGDVAALIQRYGLPADAVSQRELAVSLDALDDIANAAAEQARDPNLGFHLAAKLPHGSYGLLEYIGRSASTVRHAGDRFLRYSTLLNDVVRFAFEQRGNVFVLSQRVPGHAACVGRQAGEMFMALVVRYLRELTSAEWNPERIAFAHAPPPDTSELEDYFRAPLVWSCGENHVELPLALLERPVASHDANLFSVLDEQAERLIASRAPKQDENAGEEANAGIAKIRAQVRAALDDGQPQLADVAKALRMSPRTLQRRLKDDGTSFQDVVDSVREELARVAMANPKYSLGEVAYLLGFSEISAFTRAFKRWTGMTPSQWRDRSNHLA